jgi:branched-chain amino acid transport system ATP-binding protein
LELNTPGHSSGAAVGHGRNAVSGSRIVTVFTEAAEPLVNGTRPAPILEAINITAGYGDLPAVRDVSLRIAPGEVVALFGPNGAGKSTTMLTLAGVLGCMRGEVRWQGRPTSASLSTLAREGLSLVPEGRSVTTRLSARDNLRLGRGGVDGALGFFPELEPLLDRPAGLLSGGEQQMLVLGRALAGRPRALLVDELSLGLAPLVVDRLLAALRRAADDEQLAVLLVEQQARRALALADRWYLLAGGAVVDTGDRSSAADALEVAYLASMTGGPTASEGGPPPAP